MKKEVSCRVIQAMHTFARKRSIAPEVLFAGIPYPLDYLLNNHERVEWEVYCRISANLRPLITDDDFETLGVEATSSAALLPATSVIARLLFTGPEFYLWFNGTPDGPCAQLFGCIESSTVQLGPNHLMVTLRLASGYEMSREFFIITKGGLALTSALLGLSPSRVVMREINRGAVYDIYCPEGGGALSWVRKAVTWPFVARAAARQLKEANEVLHERYDQLEAARARIQRQALQLRTAFSIGEHIRSNLNLESTIEAAAESLVSEAHFAWVKVEICSTTDAREVRRGATKGEMSPGSRLLTRMLKSHGKNLGTLSVSLPQAAELNEAEELLDQIAPNIAMEISDALSFTLLTEYRDRDKFMQQEFSRQQIESQEAERKRLAAELHDGLGQDLLVMNNDLQLYLMNDGDSKNDLKQVALMVQEAIDDVREISANLHPHHLERLGLCAAIETMVEKVSRSSGLAVCLGCDDLDCVLPQESGIHVYRIVQEALSNIVQHASATSAHIEMKKLAGLLEITVRDNGRGFDPDKPAKREPTRAAGERFRGFGLSTMAERTRIIGGTMTIDSALGSGTTVHVAVPFS